MGKSVFILEEDHGIQDAMRHVLERAGYHVVFSNFRDMALKPLSVKPALIILGFWQEKNAKITSLKQLRSESDFSTIPILGTSVEKPATHLTNEIVDDILFMPFDINELEEKVRNLMGKTKQSK